MFTEDITAIVVDAGGLYLKAGYSGEDTPRVLYPSYSCVVEEENSKKMQSQIEKQIPSQNPSLSPAHFNTGSSSSAQKHYTFGETHLSTPSQNADINLVIKNGKILDWDAYQQLLEDLYQNKLGFQDNIIDPQTYSLLLSEPSINYPKQREKICEIAFEKLAVPNYFVVKSAVLSCFSSGRSTALILDSGAHSTYSVPVHDGYALQKGIIKYDIGGELVSEMLLNHIQKDMNIKVNPRYLVQYDKSSETKKVSGLQDLPFLRSSFNLFNQMQIIRDLKISLCRVDDRNYHQSMGMGGFGMGGGGGSIGGASSGLGGEGHFEQMEYELPDLQTVTLDFARTKFTEYFFSPGEICHSYPELMSFKGIHQMIIESTNLSDIDIKRELFSNIIITGGNSLLPGLTSQLQNQINDIAPPNSKVQILAYPSQIERKFSSWIGGSILASLGSFQSLWIGHSEYNENGGFIVEKQCP